MFTEIEIEQFTNWLKEVKSKKNTKNQHSFKRQSEREIWLENNPCPISNKIIEIYDSGYGYKTICKELKISYTTGRNFLQKIKGFKGRKGQDVVTDVLKKTRSENVKGEKSPWYDWPNRKPELMANSGKSINGYYKRKHDGKYVWLRSTYEYIYAKWLDKRNAIWYIEERTYNLKNGEKYRPDFFIYNDETLELQCIVEIKSRYYTTDNREYKFHMFKEEYDIQCSIITNLDIFIEKNSNYFKEIEKWKSERQLSLKGS